MLNSSGFVIYVTKTEHASQCLCYPTYYLVYIKLFHGYLQGTLNTTHV